MRGTTPRLATLLAAALLLTGCGGSPEPQPLPRPTASTSPSASPSPSAPVLPDRANQKSDAGVDAFARHFVDVINFATNTGELGTLSSLAAKECTSCRGISARLSAIYAAGGSVRSNGWQVTAVDVVPDQPETRKYADLAITQSPQRVIEKAGAKPQQFPGGKQTLTLLMAWRNDGWAVTRMSLAG